MSPPEPLRGLKLRFRREESDAKHLLRWIGITLAILSGCLAAGGILAWLFDS